MTHGEGVYDVTAFVNAHPGGNKIMLAAGSALEPYWSMYAQHKQPQVCSTVLMLRVVR
jgi:sulfite oxidase